MPLSFYQQGDNVVIKQIKGTVEMDRRLRELGFLPGEQMRVISKSKNGIIVQLKDCRIALNNDTAHKILI